MRRDTFTLNTDIIYLINTILSMNFVMSLKCFASSEYSTFLHIEERDRYENELVTSIIELVNNDEHLLHRENAEEYEEKLNRMLEFHDAITSPILIEYVDMYRQYLVKCQSSDSVTASFTINRNF